MRVNLLAVSQKLLRLDMPVVLDEYRPVTDIRIMEKGSRCIIRYGLLFCESTTFNGEFTPTRSCEVQLGKFRHLQSDVREDWYIIKSKVRCRLSAAPSLPLGLYRFRQNEKAAASVCLRLMA